jgi:UDP-N-acetylglucosamine:LPS N-acetylglucosamine transferase
MNQTSHGESRTSHKENARTQVLVSCGSQGSASIFDAVLELLPRFSEIDFHIIL